MWRSCRWWLPLACLVILSVVTSAQDEKPSEETKAPPARSLDAFKLPAGAIFVIGKELGDAIGISPEMLVLKKEVYQSLTERIDQLERLLQPGKPQPPSVCKISGRIEGDRVHFLIRYEFATNQARTNVALGGQRSWPVAVTMDNGELPLLLSAGGGGSAASAAGSSEDWLVVRVDKPG